MELRGRETGARAVLTVLSTKGDFFYFSFFFLWVAHNVFPVNRGLSRGVSTIPQPVIMSVGNECFTAGGGAPAVFMVDCVSPTLLLYSISLICIKWVLFWNKVLGTVKITMT